MYQSIFVPLDGSPAAEHALPWAISIAQRAGAGLHIARVHVPPAAIGVANEFVADAPLDESIRDIEANYLDEVAQRVTSASSLNVQRSLLDGTIADAIRTHALANKAGLIVMTTHGRGPFARFWLGSVADAIIRTSPVPILLVPPSGDQPADLTVRQFISRMIIPLDGSPLAERIIGPAMKLGKTLGAQFSLVTVLDSEEALRGSKINAHGEFRAESRIAAAETYLEQQAQQMRSPTRVVHKSVVRHESAAQAILDFANSNHHPVIALATHGRSGLKRMLLGSVADKIIRAATTPVLVYHPAEGE